MSETDTADIHTQELEEGHTALPSLDRIAEPELLSFMESALDRLSIENLSTLEQAIREKHRAKQDEARQTARQSIEEQLQRTGLSLGDLFPELLPQTGRKRGEGGPVPPKYRGPNGEMWSGRGHEPKWLQALTVEGRNKEEFLIAKDVG